VVDKNTQGIILDPWFEHYAERSSGLSASEVRSLFAVASRPEVVSLAGGMPYVRAISPDQIKTTLNRVIDESGPEALQYGSGQGHPLLREHITRIMALEGIAARPDDVVVTTGSQHGLDLVARLFINPGDVVLAESPSYVGALGVFRSYQADVRHVQIDDEGIIPAALSEAITQAKAENQPIKMIYLIPNFQNPAGVTLSAARRLEIIDIAHDAGILIVEDNPYGLLWFDQPAPPAMRAAGDKGIIYLGSFSKTFAPGLRVGWVVAPHGIREKLILANEAAVLSPSTFSQLVAADYLSQTDWQAQITSFRELYRERRDAMVSALAHELPDIEHTTPGGGFFLWLTLPEGLNSKEMLPRAVTELVAYTPGTAFFADDRGAQHLRLAFCYPPAEKIAEGVARLAKVIRDEVELVNTFGPTQAYTNPNERVASPPPNLA
jgi:2-aminoadipate transaminase